MVGLERTSLLRDDDDQIEQQSGLRYQALDKLIQGRSENGLANGHAEEVGIELVGKKGVTLTWQDITVNCPEKNIGIIKKKIVPACKILSGVSGVAEPGNMIAIMGASGCGKTTLLNVLTGRVAGDLEVQGRVLVNGKQDDGLLECVSGYIQQEDLFIGTLTVKEHLWFTLGLTRSQNTIIGIPGRLKGISGGEKKRLALAAESLIEAYGRSPEWHKIRWHLESINLKDDFIVEMDKVAKGIDHDELSPSGKDGQHEQSNERYSANFGTQFTWLYWRCWKSVLRNRKLTGLLLGFVFYQQTYNQTGIRNISGAVFVMLVQVSFNTCFVMTVALVEEHPVFHKEHDDRMYCVLAYYLSRVLCDLPPLVFGGFLYVTITYWLIGHMSASLFPSAQLCLTVTPVIMGVFLLFSGFLVQEETVLPIFLPILYASPYRYAFKGLLILQWRDVTSIERLVVRVLGAGCLLCLSRDHRIFIPFVECFLEK
ncbi:hypothetical protein CAPTEDRAFT_188039 [Capitella teleta]|uniref:ABC transporter domain-containing protein n=1 Tax=Capitella teleta TaxID=283909 RepID=R7UMU6_CAPTE|nr:hypothetical protein CAPTEDRAFT_188039 [Capitella teleta]|eukprot:ELU07535.1 hypothetical protein CAPTEDRAFT_188039 [Capitella teleta]